MMKKTLVKVRERDRGCEASKSRLGREYPVVPHAGYAEGGISLNRRLSLFRFVKLDLYKTSGLSVSQ
jgi:hypothetical protein